MYIIFFCFSPEEGFMQKRSWIISVFSYVLCLTLFFFVVDLYVYIYIGQLWPYDCE